MIYSVYIYNIYIYINKFIVFAKTLRTDSNKSCISKMLTRKN